jgi:hypothetical protein
LVQTRQPHWASQKNALVGTRSIFAYGGEEAGFFVFRFLFLKDSNHFHNLNFMFAVRFLLLPATVAAKRCMAFLSREAGAVF